MIGALPLTAVQLRVLRALCAGSSDEAIAATLGITPSTVRRHIAEIGERTGRKPLEHLAGAQSRAWLAGLCFDIGKAGRELTR